jgi:serine/threonine protein kinase/formylglycine-generating enzyme required for sulfatase activity
MIPSPPPSTTFDSLFGAVVAEYRLQHLIGRGGFGSVYLGEHGAMPGLRAAVKIARRELSEDAAFVDTLRVECKHLASIKHQHIASFLHFVGDGPFAPALVMELVEGGSLEGKLEAGRQDPSVVWRWLNELLEALGAAHAQGLVHRDVKPSNVLLTADARVRLVDFGLARAFERSLSCGGGFTGTFRYAAPEVLKGRGAEPAADLYGAGLVAWELLVGHRACLDGAAGSPGALVNWHLEKGPATLRPQAASLGVPLPLAELVDALCSRDPDRRLQSAQRVRASGGAVRLISPAPTPPGPDSVARPTPLLDLVKDSVLEGSEPSPPLDGSVRSGKDESGTVALDAMDTQQSVRVVSEGPLFIRLGFLVLLVLSGLATWQVQRGNAVREEAERTENALRAEVDRLDRARLAAIEEAARKEKEREAAARKDQERKEAERKLAEAKEAERKRVSGSVWVGKSGYRMRGVPAGTYQLGCTFGQRDCGEFEPVHSVTLTRAFYIGETEVTQGLWEQVTKERPWERPAVWGESSAGNGKVGKSSNKAPPQRPVCSGAGVGPDFPVMCVSWVEVVRFANLLSAAEGLELCYQIEGEVVSWAKGSACLGYRLPTEAEWETAARAGGDPVYSGGADVCKFGNIANRAREKEYRELYLDVDGWTLADCDDGFTRLGAVGRLSENEIGLKDMSGNVREWVWDGFVAYEQSSIDPRPTAQGPNRVYRGGGWISRPADARVSARAGYNSSYRINSLGVRLARTIP